MFDNLDNPSKYDGATLLVDGDIVAYQAAAASDGRCYTVGSTEFKYKKDAVEHCESNGTDISEIQLDYRPEPISHALHNIKLNLNTIQSISPSGSMEVYLTGNDNYRKQIDPEYKAHRKAMRVPHHLAECKQYLMNKHGAVLEEGLEADDLLGIRQMELAGQGTLSIIASLDKDLKCIPGLHYGWRKDELVEMTLFESNQFFYEQVLMGDATDNIKGLKGIGPKKAHDWMNALEGFDNEEEIPYLMYLHALHLYCKKTPRLDGELVEDWLGRIQKEFKKTAQLVWIQREKYKTWMEPEEA